MSPTEPHVYLNGRFLPRSQATFDIEDRGTMFADGVYEVVRYYNARPLALDRHIARLKQSLAAIRITEPTELPRLGEITAELLNRNHYPEASVYWQVTRGPAKRHHLFPAQPKPTVLVLAYPLQPIDLHAPPPTVTAILADDIRWQHCAIKSLMLLPNVLAKNQAHDAGADEAILHRGDTVTEGTSTNVMVVRGGELWTHPANQWILGGITRSIILELARAEGITVFECAVTVSQLLEADEVFVSGSTTHVAGVLAVDGQVIGGGAVGPVTQRLHRALFARIAQECGIG
jgi:D-alanine transaminase